MSKRSFRRSKVHSAASEAPCMNCGQAVEIVLSDRRDIHWIRVVYCHHCGMMDMSGSEAAHAIFQEFLGGLNFPASPNMTQ